MYDKYERATKGFHRRREWHRLGFDPATMRKAEVCCVFWPPAAYYGLPWLAMTCRWSAAAWLDVAMAGQTRLQATRGGDDDGQNRQGKLQGRSLS